MTLTRLIWKVESLLLGRWIRCERCIFNIPDTGECMLYRVENGEGKIGPLRVERWQRCCNFIRRVVGEESSVE